MENDEDTDNKEVGVCDGPFIHKIYCLSAAE